MLRMVVGTSTYGKIDEIHSDPGSDLSSDTTAQLEAWFGEYEALDPTNVYLDPLMALDYPGLFDHNLIFCWVRKLVAKRSWF